MQYFLEEHHIKRKITNETMIEKIQQGEIVYHRWGMKFIKADGDIYGYRESAGSTILTILSDEYVKEMRGLGLRFASDDEPEQLKIKI